MTTPDPDPLTARQTTRPLPVPAGRAASYPLTSTREFYGPTARTELPSPHYGRQIILPARYLG